MHLTNDVDTVDGGPATPAYTVSVRNLCGFAARSGDLDLRFTPSPTALQGRQGHQWVAQRRGPDYESEVSLSGHYRGLRVRGRADGFDARTNTLEEVKTFRGAREAIAANQQALHWAQLRIYGWLMCHSRALPGLTLNLVYLDIGDQSEHVDSEDATADELQVFFEALCDGFLAWSRQEAAHRRQRDQALEQLVFPQLAFRTGQRELAGAVYRACVQSLPLMVQAPTGIGKTLATLFPALRAMPVRGIDKVFFLTAKTPGRQVALDALATLGAAGAGGQLPLPLRVIELVARDKACEHKDKACHGQSCPLAQGFFDRLPRAREAAAARAWLDRRALREVALEQRICPYYLGHEMLRWSDVVVADYNYYFDRSAMLYALTVETPWRVAVLVDEAHNLVPRACSMYSAELTHAETLALRPDVPPSLRGRLDALLNQWQLLVDERARLLPDQTWSQCDAVPEAWLRALQKLNAALGEHVNAQAADRPSALLPFYFRTLAFAALADAFGDHSLCEFDRSDLTTPLQDAGQIAPQAPLAADGFDWPQASTGKLTLRNIVPGPFLAPRIQAADTLVLFSATLHPAHYYSALLGMPDHTRLLDLPSPFHRDQLTVRIVPVSTRRDERAASLETLVTAIATQFAHQPGNYLAFFSSFDYMEQAMRRLQQGYPAIAVWAQARLMDENARHDFLRRFEAAGQGIAFAVLGGVFGEGVDLPGKRLIGAFVATLGLPQFDPVNEAIRARMQQRFGNGYDFTYVYPGLQKVVQAAGRVIRSEQDTGTVVLLDERYRQRRYRDLLPSWWPIPTA